MNINPLFLVLNGEDSDGVEDDFFGSFIIKALTCQQSETNKLVLFWFYFLFFSGLRILLHYKKVGVSKFSFIEVFIRQKKPTLSLVALNWVVHTVFRTKQTIETD